MGDQAEIRQILVANDHAGVEFKAQLRSSSSLKDVTFVDLGVFETTSVDYPDVAVTLAEKMKNVPNALGLLICGSGIGVSMAASPKRASSPRPNLFAGCFSIDFSVVMRLFSFVLILIIHLLNTYRL